MSLASLVRTVIQNRSILRIINIVILGLPFQEIKRYTIGSLGFIYWISLNRPGKAVLSLHKRAFDTFVYYKSSSWSDSHAS